MLSYRTKQLRRHRQDHWGITTTMKTILLLLMLSFSPLYAEEYSVFVSAEEKICADCPRWWVAFSYYDSAKDTTKQICFRLCKNKEESDALARKLNEMA